jgi:hypothetical protein
MDFRIDRNRILCRHERGDADRSWDMDARLEAGKAMGGPSSAPLASSSSG